MHSLLFTGRLIFSLFVFSIYLPLYASSLVSPSCTEGISKISSQRNEGNEGNVNALSYDLNSPESLSFIFEQMKQNAPGLETAQREFLNSHSILSYSEGGIGFTFAAKNHLTGEIHRYKGTLKKVLGHPLLDFRREIDLAVRAGEIGIGPKAGLHSATGLLKMDEIVGMNLHDFEQHVLAKMPETEKETWTSNFLTSFSGKLQKLHELGIAHLDVKPSNIMVPTDNAGGQKMFLIDYGFGLTKGEFDGMHQKLREHGAGYSGTEGFQGKESLAGKPGFSDDLDSFLFLIEKILPQNGAHETAFQEQPFIKNRPMLRAAFSLFDQSVPYQEPSKSQGGLSDFQLLSLSIQNPSSPEEQQKFWTAFKKKFELRSAGQQLKILFSEPLLVAQGNPFFPFNRETLKDTIDAGMVANHWEFDPLSSLGVRVWGNSFLSIDVSSQMDSRFPVDFKELKKVRETLGPIQNGIIIIH